MLLYKGACSEEGKGKFGKSPNKKIEKSGYKLLENIINGSKNLFRLYFLFLFKLQNVL